MPQPIRNERTRRIAAAPWSNDQHEIDQENTSHQLSDADALESDKVVQQVACFCGCLRPPGGFCSICGEIICESCFARCAGCNCPLGPCHYVRAMEQPALVACRACHGAFRRRRLFTGIRRALLDPFVEFKGPPDAK